MCRNAIKMLTNLPLSVSAGTPRLLELSLMKASAEFVNVCGDNVKSWPLDESNRSNVAVTASVVPATKFTKNRSIQNFRHESIF